MATLGAEAREYVDEGLRSLTEYGYAVSAFDGGGNESVQSGVSRARTEGMAVPSGVRARDGIGRIEVIWEAVGDEELLGYDVYRSPRPDESFERLPGVEGTPFTTGRTSYVDTSVQAGRAYYYRVQSVGRTYRSELSVFVDGEALADEVAPESPRNLSAVADESEFGRVSVTWNAPLVDDDGGELTGLSGYQVFRSQGTTDSFVQVAAVSRAAVCGRRPGGVDDVLLHGVGGGRFGQRVGSCGSGAGEDPGGGPGVTGSSAERVGRGGGRIHGPYHGALERPDDGRGRGGADGSVGIHGVSFGGGFGFAGSRWRRWAPRPGSMWTRACAR